MKIKTIVMAFTGVLMCVFTISNSKLLQAEIGENHEAPAFVLTDLDGKDSGLNDLLKGNKVILLNFWATWCPSCRHEIPELVELQKKFSGREFSVIGIDVGESEKRVSSYKEKYSINYPLVVDRASEVAKKYGVVGLPASFLVDSSGKILGVYHEFSDDIMNDVKKEIS